MKTVAVVVKRGSSEAVSLAAQVRARFPDLELLAEPDLAAATGWPATSQEEMARRAELILVLGGDGPSPSWESTWARWASSPRCREASCSPGSPRSWPARPASTPG